MPEGIDDNKQLGPRIQDSDYPAIQRAGLRESLVLSAEAVAPAVSEIEARHRQVCETADKRLAEMTAKIETGYRDELEAAVQAHAEWVEQLERDYAAAREATVRKTELALAQDAAEFEQIEKDASRQKEDNLLMVETVAHATIKGLRNEFVAVQRKIADQRELLNSLRESTRETLRDYKYDPEQHSASETATAGPGDPYGEFGRQYSFAVRQLDILRTLPPPRLFGDLRAFVMLILFCGATVGATWIFSVLKGAQAPRFTTSGPAALAASLLIGLFTAMAFRRIPRELVSNTYEPLRQALAAAETALDQSLEHARRRLDQEQAKANAERDQDLKDTELNADFRITQAGQRRAESRQASEQAREQRLIDYEQRRETALKQNEAEQERKCRELRERHDSDLAKARQVHEERVGDSRRTYESARAALEASWRAGLSSVKRLLDATDEQSRRPSLDWREGVPSSWRPPADFAAFIPFGHWRLDLSRLAAPVRAMGGFLDKRASTASIPALLQTPENCSLLLQTERDGRAEAIGALRAVMLRLLTSLPPGRVHFTIVDPVGLGENFAGFMHLGDYEEALVGGRIWTESEHIEARLTELTSHMENVIQKYLRNEFETIDAYNQQAGELAEPYRFLVIADFPANFSDGAARRLNSIVNSGARCGVFTLIARDKRLPTPPEIQLDDLETGSVHLAYERDGFVVQDELLRQFPLILAPPPDEDTLTRLMHLVGRGAKDSLRVETPFEAIAPEEGRHWTGDSREELSVPLGQTGAVRLQRLRLGRGITQHALIAGKTGSGKSTLLHVVITNLSLWYSPDEVEFYLVDFKKGVEFKTYVTHGLPHARAVAIESDREFGVSVLQRIDAEMARRGDMFRTAGVQDLPAYRRESGAVLPRILLVVDEFQVFFTEDDRLSQESAILLDRLVRQGRAFGIHVLLGSQTLGGAAGLARSTLGQMAVRIALNCSEADSQLILDDTNVAARLLTRPGEAIYNDAGGLVEGNSPFQTAWLSDAQRGEMLARVQALAKDLRMRGKPMIVFEGAAPADIRQNLILAELLDAPRPPSRPAAPQAWLGEAVAIKDPTSATFKRQSGANLLIVGQRGDAATAMLASAMLCLGVQHSPEDARFVILDSRPADARREGGIEKIARLLPHETRVVEWSDVAGAIADLAAEMQRRLRDDRTDAPAVFVLVHGLQRYRMLRRQEEDFSFSADEEEKPPAPDEQFLELLREGPPLGIHVLVWSDTLAAVERTLDRKTLGEFDNRVLFQMSAADSSNLIDAPDANKLGHFRALLYSEEHGLVEKFRPYAAFDADWLEGVNNWFL